MKINSILNIIIYFIMISFGNLKVVSNLKSKTQISCDFSAPKYSWNDSSEFCGEEKNKLSSLDQCESTEVKKIFLGYTWFYCYPTKTRKDIYYRIELRACILYNEIKMSLDKGHGYNDKCYKPRVLSSINLLKLETECVNNLDKEKKNQIIQFDVKNYFEFFKGKLVCRT